MRSQHSVSPAGFGARDCSATHMLNSMRHPRHVNLVTEVPNIDVHGSTSLIGLGIVNQEGFELVGKADHAIGPIIQGRGFEVIRH